MNAVLRHSPVVFEGTPVRTKAQDHWMVVLEYDNEGTGPHLVDLCHRSRWDVQDSNLSELSPFGRDIPDHPGGCALKDGVMINRMNRTQAAVWYLSGDTLKPPEEIGYTETTDATAFLALFGSHVFSITEKLTGLDLQDPLKPAPFLTQGPFSHVPCQIVTLDTRKENSGILLTCSRGYARDMVHAIMDAGREFGLRPSGEDAFSRWIGAYNL